MRNLRLRLYRIFAATLTTVYGAALMLASVILPEPERSQIFETLRATVRAKVKGSKMSRPKRRRFLRKHPQKEG